MAKSESPTIVQGKLEAEFGKNAPKKDCIIAIFQRFYETGTIENREHSERPSKITEEKIDKVPHVSENHQQASVRTVATACSIFRTIACQIISALKPYEAQFVQKLG